MNLSRVKLLKEDATHYHLHDLRDGKPFSVAKKGLRPQTMEAFKKHFATGGTVPPDMDTVPAPGGFGADNSWQTSELLSGTPSQTYGFESGSSMNPAPGTEPNIMPKAGEALPPAMQQAVLSAQTPRDRETMAPPVETPADQDQKKPPVQNALDTAAATPLPQMPSLPDNSKAMAAAFDQQKQGQADYANAVGQSGKEMAAINDTTQKALMAAHQESVAERAQLDSENKALASSMQDMDPNRMWHHMSTGQHVMSGIAMVLGGLGSGLTGQPNAALQVFKDASDKDIRAQEADLGKKKSLLSNNLARFHNSETAENMTRAQILTGQQVQLQKAMATAQGPEAQARAQSMMGALEEQKQQALNAVAAQQYQTKLQKLSVAQSGAQQDVLNRVKSRVFAGEGTQDDAMLMHESGQGEYMVQRHNGKWALANSKESAKAFRESGTTVDSTMEALSRASSYVDNNGMLTRMAPFGEVPAVGEAISKEMIPKLNELAGLKRLSAEDIKIMEGRLNKLTSIASGKTLKAQLNEIQNDINSRIIANENNFTYIQRPRGR